jgi:Putative zinc-finger
MSEASGGHPRELLSAYLDDELDLEQRAAVDHHLADCAVCRDDLESLSALASAMAVEPVPPVPDDLAVSVGARIDAATVVPFRRWRWILPASIAATIAAVGLLVAFSWRDGRVYDSVRAVPEDNLARRSDELLPAPAPAAPPPAVQEEGAPASVASAGKAKTSDNVPAAPTEPRYVRPSSVGYVAGGSESAERKKEVPEVAKDLDALRRPEPAAAPPAGMIAGRQATVIPSAPTIALPPSNCAENWLDAGSVGTFSVRDAQAAERDLAAVASAHGGTGEMRRWAEGDTYGIVVPASRFGELVSALKAKGVTGLDGSLPAAGDVRCIKQRIRIVVLGDVAPPR